MKQILLLFTVFFTIFVFSLTEVQAAILADFPITESIIDYYSWFSSIHCFNGTNSYALSDLNLKLINAEYTEKYKTEIANNKINDFSIVDRNTEELLFLNFEEILDDETILDWYLYKDRFLKVRITYSNSLSSDKIKDFEEIILQRESELINIIGENLSRLYCSELIDKTKVPRISSGTAIPFISLTSTVSGANNNSLVAFYRINYLFVYTNETNFQTIEKSPDTLIDAFTIKIFKKEVTLPFRFSETIRNVSSTFWDNVTFDLLEIKKKSFVNSIYIIKLNSTFYANIFQGYGDRIGTDIAWSVDLNDRLDEIENLRSDIVKSELEVLEKDISEVNLTLEREKQLSLNQRFLDLLKTEEAARKSLELSTFYSNHNTIQYYLEYENVYGSQELRIPFTTDFSNYLNKVDFVSDIFENIKTSNEFFESIFIQYSSLLSTITENLDSYDSTLSSIQTQQQLIISSTQLNINSTLLTVAFYTFFISFLAFIITIASKSKSIGEWVATLFKPNVKFFFEINPDFIIKPSDKKEISSENISVPYNKDVLLYFSLRTLDKRHYSNPIISIQFPRIFKIKYSIPYEKMFFGKKIHPIKPYEALIKSNFKLIKGQTDPLLFPIVVKTPKKNGKYKVRLELSSESTLSESTVQELEINIVKGLYSHDKNFFNYKNFIAK